MARRGAEGVREVGGGEARRLIDFDYVPCFGQSDVGSTMERLAKLACWLG